MGEDEAFAFNEEFVNGYFTEEQWNNYIKSIKIDCQANEQIQSCKAS